MEREYIDLSGKDFIQKAQISCASISDPAKRNRAVANNIAVGIAEEFFSRHSYIVDADTGLYNIPFVEEEYDIADIYVNGTYVDVRVYFSEDELSVPKTHFITGIVPAVYMFVKLAPDLSSAEVTGFARSDVVQRNESDASAYVLSEDSLVSLYDVETRLRNTLDIDDVEDLVIHKYLEGSLETSDKTEMIRIMTKSKISRMKLKKAQKAYYVLSKTILDNVDDVVSYEPTEENSSEYDNDSFLDLLNEEEQNSESPGSYNESFSTEVTPSGYDLIESLDNEPIQTEKEEETETFEAEGDSETSEEEQVTEFAEQTEQSAMAEESIDTLFTGEQEGVPVPKKRKTTLLPLLLILLAVSGAYLLYTNFNNKNLPDENVVSQDLLAQDVEQTQSLPAEQKTSEEPMPVESVETADELQKNEELSSVSIPAIEQNLNTSVLVANLKVDWEVPAGYVANTAAKRYLVKLGKIIQLNLKTELLLLHRPPLTNKITVEIKFNPEKAKFEVIGIKNSSGEKSVDDLILQTVRSALNTNLSIQVNAFAGIQGNPVLIIHL